MPTKICSTGVFLWGQRIFKNGFCLLRPGKDKTIKAKNSANKVTNNLHTLLIFLLPWLSKLFHTVFSTKTNLNKVKKIAKE